MTDGHELVEDLRAAVSAEVSSPEDPGYATARPWNLAIEMHPLAVVHATGRADW